MEELESMVIRLMGDGKSYQQMITEAVGSTQGLAKAVGVNSSQIKSLTQSLEGLGSKAQGILGMLAGGLGIGSLLGTVQTAIFKAAETEQIEIAFKSLIGDAKLAQSTLADLREFAVKTPFELPQILEAAKSMLAYGQQAETIVPTMQRLGDVASALNIPLSSLTYLYGTLKSSGRVMTVDMRQFANRGIPIWLELAKTIGMVGKETRELTGAQSGQLQQMVSKGQITFEMIEKSFINLTSQGGRFFKMMEDQSASFNGIVSNLKDSLGLLLADIGKQIIEGFDLKRVVAEVRDFATAAAEWFKNMDPQAKKFIFILLGVVGAVSLLVAGFLAVKAAVLAISFIVGTIGLPFLVIAAAIVVAVAYWVESVGGIGKALDIAKEKLVQFWKFIEPVRLAIIALVKTSWQYMVVVWTALWNTAKSIWTAITGDVEVNWTDIRDFIVDAILFVAYSLGHIKEVGALAFAFLKMLAIDYYKTIIEWSRPGYASLMLLATAFGANTDAIKEAYDTLDDMTLGGQLINGLQDASDEAHKSFEELTKKTAVGFKKFKEDALAVKPDDVVKKDEVKKTTKAAEEAGKQVGQAMKKGIKDGLGDAMLFGSQEHLHLIDAYMQKINEANNKLPDVAKVGKMTNPQFGMPEVSVHVVAPGIAPDSDWGKTLEEIRDILKDQRNGPVLELEGANVGGVD
jgi:hypothetical protein